jgi:hypothetical protein
MFFSFHAVPAGAGTVLNEQRTADVPRTRCTSKDFFASLSMVHRQLSKLNEWYAGERVSRRF